MMKYLLLLVFLCGCSVRHTNVQPLILSPAQTVENITPSEHTEEAQNQAKIKTTFLFNWPRAVLPEEDDFNRAYFCWTRAFSLYLAEDLAKSISQNAEAGFAGIWHLEIKFSAQYKGQTGYFQIITLNKDEVTKGLVLQSRINPLDYADKEAEKVSSTIMAFVTTGKCQMCH